MREMGEAAQAIYAEFGYDERLNVALVCHGEHVLINYVAQLKREIREANCNLNHVIDLAAKYLGTAEELKSIAVIEAAFEYAENQRKELKEARAALTREAGCRNAQTQTTYRKDNRKGKWKAGKNT